MTQIITALDISTRQELDRVLDLLDPQKTKVKIGKQLFTAMGPVAVHTCHNQKFDVFLDLKYHDIPNTVEQAILAAGQMGVWMTNVHIQGGPPMLIAARRAAVKANIKVIGVTELTSVEDRSRVPLFVSDGHRVGLDGVVCHVNDMNIVNQIRANRVREDDEFIAVCPGIRLPNDNPDDQANPAVPSVAKDKNVDYIVMGRSILNAPNPQQTLTDVYESLK